jgi:hypothetical protein
MVAGGVDTNGRPAMDEQGPLKVHSAQAWASFIAMERQELQLHREGHLARNLGPALPDESTEELRRRLEEEQLTAKEGLVELMDERGQITYKHIDELAPEDRLARIRAAAARLKWIAERQTKRRLSPRSPSLTGSADG